jgi:hypothetical protein
MIARQLVLGAALVLAAGSFATPAAAQNYPDRPIKLIVPFPPGGPIDTMARFMIQSLGTSLGQSTEKVSWPINAKMVMGSWPRCRARWLHRSLPISWLKYHEPAKTHDGAGNSS